MSQTSLRIIGIDPGSVITGVGIIDWDQQQLKPVHHRALATGKGSFNGRLQVLFNTLSDTIREYEPDVIAIEQVFVQKNVSSALKLGHARATALCAAFACSDSIDTAEYTPSEIKQALVGRGGADKAQVQHMVKILLNIKSIDSLDASDALAVAICHALQINMQRKLDDSVQRQSKRRSPQQSKRRLA